MKIKGSVLIVTTFLLGTAMAMAFSEKDEVTADVVEVASKIASFNERRNKSESQQLQTENNFDLSAIKRTSPRQIKSSELFQSKSWYTPPTVPKLSILSLPPSIPSAPQLLFLYSGRMIDGDQVILFLSKGGQQYTVKVGDVIDESYRLDKVDETNAVLTYLPMNLQQTLVFNSTAVGALSANDLKKN